LRAFSFRFFSSSSCFNSFSFLTFKSSRYFCCLILSLSAASFFSYFCLSISSALISHIGSIEVFFCGGVLGLGLDAFLTCSSEAAVVVFENEVNVFRAVTEFPLFAFYFGGFYIGGWTSFGAFSF